MVGGGLGWVSDKKGYWWLGAGEYGAGRGAWRCGGSGIGEQVR